MDWNNGTIFRAFITTTDVDTEVKLDIAQQELNGKCFIGIENFMMKPNVDTDEQKNFWAETTYLQFQSYQLSPYIDYNADATDASNSSNTQIFARLPLIAVPTLGDSLLTTEATFGMDRVLNKDSVLYEMINNPYALSNGILRFRLLGEDGQPIAADDLTKLWFTLVIYKASPDYN